MTYAEEHFINGFPFCDTCHGPALWSEGFGWLHLDAETGQVFYPDQDPSGHEPTAREWSRS